MPICSDPSDTIPFSLKSDEGKPPESRPTFHLRFLTDRESRRVLRLLEQAQAEQDPDREAELVVEAIRVGLVRVDRLTHGGQPVTAETDPQDYLSSTERWELGYAVHNRPLLTEADRGKSASGAASRPALTAPTAAPEAA